MRVTIFSPAKINLYLAVTGRRADGYHDLISVAAPLEFGDELVAEGRECTVPACWDASLFTAANPVSVPTVVGRSVCPGQSPGKGAGSQFSLECDHPEVPLDDSNLIFKAARAFAAATGWEDRVAFRLTKRIPPGAGLGGGSSNAVAALRALNRLSGGLLSEPKLAEVAAELGSDCALFLHNRPVVMRGRGERIEALPEAAGKRLRGQRVLLFKPGFGISTPWAYQRMVASSSAKGTEDRRSVYMPEAEAEERLAAWIGGRAPAGGLLFNNLEGVAFEKFIALPVLLGKLQSEFGVAGRMSGSGSACFALLGDPSTDSTGSPQASSRRRQGYGRQAGQAPSADVVTRMKHMIHQCWGPLAFVQEARLA